MSEIKSVIEIAMEKTKHLKMTEEETERFKKDELIKKAEGLLSRYLSGKLELEKLKGEINSQKREREELLQSVLLYLINSITIVKNPKHALEALKHLLENDAKEIVLRKIEDTFVRFEQDEQREYKNFQLKLKEELQLKGFSGSAVLPNVESSKKWHHYLKDLTNRYEEEITVLKKKLIQHFK